MNSQENISTVRDFYNKFVIINNGAKARNLSEITKTLIKQGEGSLQKVQIVRAGKLINYYKIQMVYNKIFSDELVSEWMIASYPIFANTFKIFRGLEEAKKMEIMYDVFNRVMRTMTKEKADNSAHIAASIKLYVNNECKGALYSGGFVSRVEEEKLSEMLPELERIDKMIYSKDEEKNKILKEAARKEFLEKHNMISRVNKSNKLKNKQGMDSATQELSIDGCEEQHQRNKIESAMSIQDTAIEEAMLLERFPKEYHALMEILLTSNGKQLPKDIAEHMNIGADKIAKMMKEIGAQLRNERLKDCSNF